MILNPHCVLRRCECSGEWGPVRLVPGVRGHVFCWWGRGFTRSSPRNDLRGCVLTSFSALLRCCLIQRPAPSCVYRTRFSAVAALPAVIPPPADLHCSLESLTCSCLAPWILANLSTVGLA